MGNSDTNWISTPAGVASSLGGELSGAVEARVREGKYSEDDAYYVSHLDLTVCEQSLDLQKEELEAIQKLCRLWDVELRPREVSSHRKIVGPIIVAAKKALYPILSIFMKDLIRQQRTFNGEVVSLVTNLANKIEKSTRSSSNEG